MGSDLVVPVPMERQGLEIDGGECLLGYLHPVLIASWVEARFDMKACSGASVAKEIEDHRVAHQRTPTPIGGNVAEHPVFDLVPLAGPGREVARRDRQAGCIRQPLETELPQPRATPVAPTRIRGDQQL